MVGDRVLVEKIGYRFGSAGRGDVVVFERELPTVVPLEEDQPFWTDILDGVRGLFGFPTGDSQDFIKRVIAIGGDTVEGRDGKVYVNGDGSPSRTSLRGPRPRPSVPSTSPTASFVMGDNRGTRTTQSFGTIPEDSVIGPAFRARVAPGRLRHPLGSILTARSPRAIPPMPSILTLDSTCLATIARPSSRPPGARRRAPATCPPPTFTRTRSPTRGDRSAGAAPATDPEPEPERKRKKRRGFVGYLAELPILNCSRSSSR